MMPRSGDVVYITRAASVQFAVPFLFRVISSRVYGHTPDGWAWITGYELTDTGDAVARRDLFVQLAGLRTVPEQPVAKPPAVRRPTNTSPSIPTQRTRTTSTARSHR